MPLGTAVKVEVLRVLVLAGPTVRAELTADECDLLVETCASVAGMIAVLPGDTSRDRGRAAHDGAALLLELGCPRVAPDLRHQLATAVGRIVRRTSPAA